MKPIWWLSLCTALVFGAACQRAKALATEAQPMTQTSPALLRHSDQAQALLNQAIVITGEAQDAKLGAVLKGPIAVYIEGMEAWPAAQRGSTLTFEGILTSSTHAMATVGEDGAISQGTHGPIWILAQPKQR